MENLEKRKKYFASLPRKTVAAGVIFLNKLGEILIIKPTYKEGWLVPGGVVEAGESPRKGCEREIVEEIGLKISVKKLLCVDHRFIKNERDALNFIFYGGVLNKKEIGKIKTDPGEISRFRFETPEKAWGLLRPMLGKRVKEALRALKEEQTLYLEKGDSVFNK